MTFDDIAENDPVGAQQMVDAGRIPGPNAPSEPSRFSAEAAAFADEIQQRAIQITRGSHYVEDEADDPGCIRCGAPLSYLGERRCVDCTREIDGFINDRLEEGS